MNLAVKPGEDSNEEGEAEEKEEDPDEPEPEVGPALLTPLSQDAGQSLTSSDKPVLGSKGNRCCNLHWRQRDLVSPILKTISNPRSRIF